MTEKNIPQPPPILTLNDLDDERRVAPAKPSAFSKLKQMHKAEQPPSAPVPVPAVPAVPVFPPLTSETEVPDNTVAFEALDEKDEAVENFNELVAEAGNKKIRHIASNPEATPESLKEFVKSDNPQIREAVAGNPNSTVKILLTLAKDKESTVLTAVAKNPNFPPKYIPTLFKAAKHFDSVKEALLARNDLPERFIKKLDKLK